MSNERLILIFFTMRGAPKTGDIYTTVSQILTKKQPSLVSFLLLAMVCFFR